MRTSAGRKNVVLECPLIGSPLTDSLMRKPAPSDPFAESQTFSDRGRGAQGERGNGRCGIGRRARRKHAATEDIEITEVVGTAILVDDRLLWICSHDGSSHYMARAAIDQIRARIPLQ